MMIDGGTDHWSGDLRNAMIEEMGDVAAARSSSGPLPEQEESEEASHNAREEVADVREVAQGQRGATADRTKSIQGENAQANA
jgi:hypothetical protein